MRYQKLKAVCSASHMLQLNRHKQPPLIASRSRDFLRSTEAFHNAECAYYRYIVLVLFAGKLKIMCILP